MHISFNQQTTGGKIWPGLGTKRLSRRRELAENYRPGLPYFGDPGAGNLGRLLLLIIQTTCRIPKTKDAGQDKKHR